MNQHSTMMPASAWSLFPRRSAPLVRPLLAWALCLTLSSVHAAPPEWIAHALRADTSALETYADRAELLHAEDVHFLPDNRVHRVERHVIRTFLPLPQPIAYSFNANTEKIVSARAWVITAKGKLIKTYRDRDFVNRIARYNDYFWNEERELFLMLWDDQGAGGAVAWEIESESTSPNGECRCSFQQKFPVVSGTFEVTPPPGTSIVWQTSSASIAAPTPGTRRGSLRWSIADVPGSSGPSPDGFLINRLTVYARPTSAGANRIVTYDSWPALAHSLFEVFRDRLAVTAPITEKARTSSNGKSTTWHRVRQLTEFVQHDVQYLSITLETDNLAGYRPHPAAETLQLRYGDCKDKATLLVSLLEAAGVKAYVCLLYAGDPRAFPADWPSLAFNHAIVAIAADDNTPATWPLVSAGPLGPLVLFDPTHPKIPLGILPVSDCGGRGLLLNATANPGLIDLPSPSPATSRQLEATTIELHAPHTLTIKTREEFFGYDAADAHVLQATEGDENLENTFRETLARQFKATESLDWKSQWDTVAGQYVFNASFQVPEAGRLLGPDRLLLSPFAIPSAPQLNPWEKKVEGVSWIQTFHRTIESRLLLPAGAGVEELPEDWRSNSSHLVAHLKYTIENGAVVARGEITVPSAFLEKRDYLLLREELRRINDRLRRPCVIVLGSATAPTNP
jgi:hypothetical protein